MLTQEIELVYGSVESSDDYSSVVQAIEPEWIENALLATGKASIRQRRIPAQQAVWLVIWMGLIRKTNRLKKCVALWI